MTITAPVSVLVPVTVVPPARSVVDVMTGAAVCVCTVTEFDATDKNLFVA